MVHFLLEWHGTVQVHIELEMGVEELALGHLGLRH
jgi:hypothetical protein